MGFWLRKNWFLIGLFASAALGFLFSEEGASGGVLRTEITTQMGVAVLFFIRGMLLPMVELRRGILAWRLHLLIHAYIFLLLPLVVLLMVEVTDLVRPLGPELRLGFLFLAALPTTISTAAVFTSLARGNTAAAVFNSTVSNCIGVIIVPLWVAWMLQREAVAVPVGPVMLQIVVLVVVPLFVGQAVKPYLWEFTLMQKRRLEAVSNGIVLYVIFAAFANSVAEGMWSGHGWETLLGGMIFAVIVFGVATLLAHAGGRALRLARADRICLFFTGPQKTLAGGVTIANIMFAGDPGLTLILLPVLFYHFVQLFAGGFVVERFRRDDEAR